MGYSTVCFVNEYKNFKQELSVILNSRMHLDKPNVSSVKVY